MNTKKYELLLTHLGMNEYERSIYLTLIKYGPMHISAIATKIGHHRPIVYRTIEGLESDGFVSKTLTVGGKRILYQATSPQALATRAASIQKQTDAIIPELEALYERNLDHPKLTLKEGIEGIRSIHADLVGSLSKGNIYYRYSSSRKEYTGRSLYIPDNYFDLQKKKELERYVITSEKRRPEREGNPYREVVSIPSGYDAFDDNITKLIYGNKVAIIDYDTQSGWVIENERFARYEEKIFRLLFKSLKKKNPSD